MSSLPQDLKFGFRLLVKKPLLTVAISLSLALGIGANSAIFSLVNAALFAPMNVGNSSRLVSLYTSDFSGPQYGGSSYADFTDFRDKTDVFESLMSFGEISASLKAGNESERAFGLLVTGNYFDLLGVKAASGRTFLPEEDQIAGTNPVLVISHKLWERRFHSDPTLVGRNVLLNSQSFTIIGITPEKFTGTDLGRSPEIFVPIQMYRQIGFESAFTTNRGARTLSVMGRLKSDVSIETAQARLNVLTSQLSQAYPDEWKERSQAQRRITLVTESYSRVPPQARQILIGLAGLFMVLVGLVLLIACSNVSNMLLARATARQREMAVRSALGASRKRLIRQLLTESLQLSLIGSVIGILIAPWCIDLLVATFVPASAGAIPLDLGLNPRVILFTVSIGLITGLVFGLVPALQASKSDLMLAMKDESMAVQTRSRRFGMRNLLVITQIAVSLILLIVAGLFIKSLEKARHLDLGYDMNNVITIRPDAEFLDSGNTARQLAFYRAVLERVRAVPGVEASSFADTIPSGGGIRRSTIGIENYTPRLGENMDVLFGIVGTQYFKTMGISLVSGREFADQDNEQAPRTGVINATMAARFWPGDNPIGKQIRIAGTPPEKVEVVGVVKDATADIFRDAPSPALYLPLLQNPGPGMTLHVRTQGDAMAMLPLLRNEINAVGENVALGEVKTLSEYMNDSLLTLRVASTLTGLFGLLALSLALVGVFSVINYSTSLRTREIGIRLALGARRADILKLILKEGLLIVMVGVAGGLLIALACGRLITLFLFENSGIDLGVFLMLSLLLTAISMLACFIPAYKATKFDPIDALRRE